MEEIDEVWHAGDIGNPKVLDSIEAKKPLRAVYGNIDGNKVKIRTKKVLNFDCEGIKVVITHIAGYPGRYNQAARNLIEKYQPNLFI